MPEPSIKGSIFGPVVDEVNSLRESGALGPEELEVALEPRDLEILDAKVSVALWYPMESYGRIVKLLCKTQGGGSPAYYEMRGSMSARRLMDSGLYSQLDLLDSIADSPDADDEDARRRMLDAYRKKLSVVLSLARSIYNVGEWKVIEDADHPGRVSIEITDAAAYTDGMAGAIVGFLDECARAVSAKIDKLYRFERPAPDRIVIRMLRDLATVRRERLS